MPKDILYIYNVYDSNESTIHTHNLKTFDNFLNGFYEVLNLFEDISYPKAHLIQASVTSLFLLFSNLDFKEKKENIYKLYELEMYLDEKPILYQKELEIMYNAIIKKHFTFAICLSAIFSFFYKNNTIRKLSRKFR